MAAFSSIQFAKEMALASRLARNPHQAADLRACLERIEAMAEAHPAEAALCEARLQFADRKSQIAKIHARLATLTPRLPQLAAQAAEAQTLSQSAHDELARLTPPAPSRRKARSFADMQAVGGGWERRVLAPAQRKADRLHAAAQRAAQREQAVRRETWALRQESETLAAAQRQALAAEPRAAEPAFPPAKPAKRGADRAPSRTAAQLSTLAIEHAATIRRCFELTADGRLLRTHFERTGHACVPPRRLALDVRQSISVCRGIMLPPQLVAGVLHGMPGHWLAPRPPATTWAPPHLFDCTPPDIRLSLELA